MTCQLVGLVLASLQGVGFPEGRLDLGGGLDAEGRPVALEPAKSKATVLLFVSSECPIANRYAPELRRIAKEYGKKGVAFFRVYLQGPEAVETVARHGNEYQLGFPALLDPGKTLVKTIGIRVTPEAAVIGRDGTLLYRGRIDDQNVEHGKIRPNYRRDLRIALEEILAGKPVSVKSTPAIGCIIPLPERGPPRYGADRLSGRGRSASRASGWTRRTVCSWGTTCPPGSGTCPARHARRP